MSTADELNELSSVGGCLIEWKEACSGAFTGGKKWRHKFLPSQLHGSCRWLSVSLVAKGRMSSEG